MSVSINEKQLMFVKAAPVLCWSRGILLVYSQVVNAAVIVDPSVKQVIASACDQTCSWSSTAKKIRMESTCLVQLENSSPFADNGIKSHVTDPDREARNPSTTLTKCQNIDFNCSSDEPTHLNVGVSCLFRWQWAKQKSQASSCYWHPLRHAAIVAIEYSSARDRRLYPGSGPIIERSFDLDHIQSPSADPLAKRQKTTFPNS